MEEQRLLNDRKVITGMSEEQLKVIQVKERKIVMLIT